VGKDIVLSVGDFVYDTKSRDIGVLLRREVSPTTRRNSDYTLYVWRIYWTVTHLDRYTENSIINMIETGHLLLYKNI
jgi:hypothetical protein